MAHIWLVSIDEGPMEPRFEAFNTEEAAARRVKRARKDYVRGLYKNRMLSKREADNVLDAIEKDSDEVDEFMVNLSDRVHYFDAYWTRVDVK